jgi:acyl-CoA thioesterase-1
MGRPLDEWATRRVSHSSIDMKAILTILLFSFSQSVIAQNDYLDSLKNELQVKWPKNRVINLVFHGHSVPAGYFKTPDVRTLDSYPHLVLQAVKEKYPYATVNVITTAIGGENSANGAERFKKTVLNHRPDVLFIDYALNDRKMGLQESAKNWRKMIKQALKQKIKIILLTPSPDQSADWAKQGGELELFSKQIIALAEEYKIGLADSFKKFQELVTAGKNIQEYMSQSNHPNKHGHQLIADEIMRYFQ